jgi:hypothetical protein
MKTMRVITAVICLLVAGSVTVFAEEQQGWKFEITPYLWLAGIDGKISLGDREVDVNQSFSDLIDKTDFAGSVQLGASYNNRFVIYSQLDYMALSESDTWRNVTAKLTSDTFMLSGAAGYRFHGGITKNSTIDVMLGGRYLNME